MKERSDHLKHVLHATLAQLLAGNDDPTKLLWKLVDEAQAESGQTVERLVDTNACSSCGTKDSICFRCKAVSLVGEQGLAAAPMLVAKLGPMVAQWASERKARKAQEAAREAQERAQAAARAQSAPRTPPPPPAGPQRF
ncbi:MAG: hypothetical protein ACYTF5_21120 [Planctomycetota bacterium]|jgi:phage shock protein A